MHIKHIHEMMEMLTKCAEMELEKGVENVDTKEMGEVVDIIKDLAEAEYYAKISKAMDEAEYGEEYDYKGAYDDGRRGYRGQPRDSRGRYMSRRRGYEEPMYYSMTPEMYHNHTPEYLRDMDREYGKMYYSDGGSKVYSDGEGGQYSSRMQRDGMGESRYDKARRGYEETKSMHKDNSSESKQMKMKSLEDYAKSLTEDVTEMVSDMSAEEKNLLRTKLQTLAQKVS